MSTKLLLKFHAHTTQQLFEFEVCMKIQLTNNTKLLANQCDMRR